MFLNKKGIRYPRKKVFLKVTFSLLIINLTKYHKPNVTNIAGGARNKINAEYFILISSKNHFNFVANCISK